MPTTSVGMAPIFHDRTILDARAGGGNRHPFSSALGPKKDRDGPRRTESGRHSFYADGPRRSPAANRPPTWAPRSGVRGWASIGTTALANRVIPQTRQDSQSVSRVVYAVPGIKCTRQVRRRKSLMTAAEVSRWWKVARDVLPDCFFRGHCLLQDESFDTALLQRLSGTPPHAVAEHGLTVF